MISSFIFASIPNIIFGKGKLIELYNLIPRFGKNVLIVIGKNSLKNSGKWEELESYLKNNSINFYQISVSGEPTPTIIDNYVSEYRDKNINLVVSIGGGSVIDAGKAISAMILKDDSIKNYLEGIGNKVHDGKKIPFIAIPTTSGTGSEATKNAVISEVGPNGFKKSLRHDNLIPNVAIVDPELMLSCPASISAACGMDAFTQLLEAYVSIKGNPITDALAYSGMKYVKDALISVCSDGASDIGARTSMAYGALISGISLANAGLGIIHGLASPIGGFFSIPHGVVCGTLMAEATKMNIKKLKELGNKGKNSLKKHAKIGALLADEKCFEKNKIDKYCSTLIETLEDWTKTLNIDRLGKYGIKTGDVDKIVENTGLKNNPVKLSKEEIKNIVLNRI
ncbi:MAG: iron-containing alcohol dehydrogenase [Promethearchaeota archaeon]